MTSNPMLRSDAIENSIELESDKPATIAGTVNKTILLTLLVVLSGSFTWDLCSKGFSDKASLLAIIGIIAGFILCLVTSFMPKHSKILAPVYALCEGLVLGSISFNYEKSYDGIVMNAVEITVLTLLSMLFLYKSGVIKMTQKLQRVIFIATCAIGIFYFAGFIGSMLGHPMTVFNGGLVGIGISLVICIFAALNFVSDFYFIENGIKNNLPQYFEWYFGISILVTLIWFYIEVLRLLAQLALRRD